MYCQKDYRRQSKVQKKLEINIFIAFKKKKEAFYVSIVEKQKHNIKKTWQTINILLGKTKNHSCTSLSIHGQLSIDDAKIADHFNNHLTTIRSDLKKNINHSGAKFDN